MAKNYNFYVGRQVGKFSIRAELLSEDPRLVRDMLKPFVIVRCELMDYGNCFEYIAYSDLFREVPRGEESPTYTVYIDGDREITVEEEK